ncbi:unnamed protein product [Orchesella dallaii]|uniref:Uncharacterized protein n=1 Tax=Orchesella dallaii TaxID=48710 RepID=A0ABP1QR52_9HEXA
MGFRMGLWRRQQLQARKAKLIKLNNKRQFSILLTQLSTESLALIKTRKYCSDMAEKLQGELVNHYEKRTEYFQVSLDVARRQFTPSPGVPSQLSIINYFQDATNLADIFCKSVKEGLELRRVEFGKIRELMQGLKYALKRKARRDPVRIEVKLEQVLVKAEQVKSKLENLKSEWDGVKDRLNRGIDDCIQQVNIRLQDALAKECGPGEE